MLKMFVDSAVRDDVEPLLGTGIFRGVTTNPTLLQAAGLTMPSLPEMYSWATGAGAQEVFLQAWGSDTGEITDCGRRLRDIGPKVVVKVPVSTAGIAATARLAGEGCPVLLTAVYNASQALLATASGATYLAPYLGRMGDAGRPAHAEITGMQTMLKALRSDSEILVASVRSTADVVSLAQHGVGAFALNPRLIAQFFDDELTAAAVEAFEEAAVAISDP